MDTNIRIKNEVFLIKAYGKSCFTCEFWKKRECEIGRSVSSLGKSHCIHYKTKEGT